MRSRVVVTSLVLLACAFGGAARPVLADELPARVDGDARERSRVAFRKGVAQLRAQDWAAARASFESAWGLFPHPSILLNLGIARLRTDEPVLAEQDLVRFLSEDVGASPDELASAREALAEARTKIGTLRVLVSPTSARIAVDGKTVETIRRADATRGQDLVAEVRAKPGFHAVAVEAEGFTTERREVQVAGRGEAVVTIALARADVSKPPPDTGPQARTIVGWSLAGLAGAALITGGITALRAKTLSDEYGDPASAHFQDAGARSEGITFRTAADVALSVAVLSGAAAVVLLFTDLGKGSSDVARAATLRW